MNYVREYPITNVHQSEDGYWIAKVGAVTFDRQWGSWQTTVALAEGRSERREAMPEVAARLQAVVKDLEAGKALQGNEAVALVDRSAAATQRAKAHDHPMPESVGLAEAAMERIEHEKMAA